MASFVKDGGIWKPSEAIYSKVAGTWRGMNRGWTKQNGVWVQFWDWSFIVNITAPQNDVNLRQLAINAGWDQNRPLVINNNSIINGVNGVDACFIIGNYPNGFIFNNNNLIRGRGGNGGNGGSAFGNSGSSIFPTAGGNGRTALAIGAEVQAAQVTINNAGTIAGGGGGGGGGKEAQGQSGFQGPYFNASGGGGGGGRSSSANSAGGATGTASGGTFNNNAAGSGNGAAGTATTQGGGGAGGRAVEATRFAQAGAGGAGGDYGQNGQAGGQSARSGMLNNAAQPGAAGGAAGAAVFGVDRVTWGQTGTRLGPLVN